MPLRGIWAIAGNETQFRKASNNTTVPGPAVIRRIKTRSRLTFAASPRPVRASSLPANCSVKLNFCKRIDS